MIITIRGRNSKETIFQYIFSCINLIVSQKASKNTMFSNENRPNILMNIFSVSILLPAKQLFLSRGLAELLIIMGNKGLPRKESCCRCNNVTVILIVKLDLDNFQLSPMLLKIKLNFF